MLLDFFRKKKKSNKPTFIKTSQKKPTSEKKTGTVDLPLPFLKTLIPLEKLEPQEILKLEIRTDTYPAGKIIFKTGEKTESLAYLTQGKVFLENDNGSGFELSSDVMKALYPLSSGEEYSVTAIAVNNATVIYIPKEQLQHINQPQGLLFTDEFVIPEQLEDNLFFKRFYKHFRQNALDIPTLPDVAVRLHQAIQKELGVSKIAKIIEADPIIAAKLIQVANSSFYQTPNPIKNCRSAITLIGLNASRSIATSISLKSLYQIKTKNINIRVRLLWKQSLKISVLSHILATLTNKTDPGEALLAGLVHNIGSLPMLKFADSLPREEVKNTEDLDYCLRFAQGIVGSIILDKWNFPESLKKIPITSNNWYLDHEDGLNLSDIVILAKYHALLETDLMHTLPPITSLPSFQKIDDKTLTPDLSLNILHDAKQQIAETMSLFKI